MKRVRIIGATVAAFAVGLTAFVPAVIDGGPPPGELLANIWVESGAGTCAGGRSSTPIAYAEAASPDRLCGSFDQAYAHVSSSGSDKVGVRSGSYGNQSFTRRTVTGPMTEYIPDGGDVTFGTVNMQGADRVYFRGSRAADGWIGSGLRSNSCISTTSLCFLSEHVAISGVELSGGFQDVTVLNLLAGAHGWTIRDFDIGENHDDKIIKMDNQCGVGCGGTLPDGGTQQTNQTTDVVFEEGSIHSQTQTQDISLHTECIWALGTQSLVIRYVQIYGCGQSMNMNYSDSGDAYQPGNLTIENSIYEPPQNEDGNDLSSMIDSGNNRMHGRMWFANNIFQGGMASFGSTVPSDLEMTFLNNIGIFNSGACSWGNTTYINNRWTGADCSASDVQDTNAFQSSRFVGAPRTDAERNNSQAGASIFGDWTYTGTGAHINGGTNTGCPIRDFTGKPRPAGSTCDQGAMEFGASAAPEGVPTANFVAPIAAGTNSVFDATSSIDPDGTIVEYHWDFSGTPVDTTSLSVTRTVANGDFVSLVVEDDEGNLSAPKIMKLYARVN